MNEGPAKNAKIERANAIRDMDREWGLRQVEANKRNSQVHARQPTRAEKEMAARGVRSDKQYIREAVTASMREAVRIPEGNKVRALSDSLQAKGVKVAPAKNAQDLTFERVSTGMKVSGEKLGRGFSMDGILGALGYTAKKSAQILGNGAVGLVVKIKRKAVSSLEAGMQESMEM